MAGLVSNATYLVFGSGSVTLLRNWCCCSGNGVVTQDKGLLLRKQYCYSGNNIVAQRKMLSVLTCLLTSLAQK